VRQIFLTYTTSLLSGVAFGSRRPSIDLATVLLPPVPQWRRGGVIEKLARRALELACQL
jgi:hypothetical protein